MNKTVKKITAMTVALVLSAQTSWAALSFSDVPVGHWAYNSVISVAEKGIMVGDTAGQFKPNDPLDKFDTSRILAAAAGYKYSGISADEQQYYDTAYNNYKNLLSSYKNTFTKWNSSADKEIAFLLAKGILIESDLAQYVIINAEKENLRALSRQEAAVFMVRLMGRTNQALTQTGVNPFADDLKIDTASKPYVYYLRSLGVVSGDTSNNFNPNGAVTRGALAVMLNGTLKLMENNVSVSQTTAVDPNTTQVTGINGTIDKVHTSLNALQIKYQSGETKIHKVESDAVIYLEGAVSSIYNLAENMPITATLRNGAITEVRAQSAAAQTAPQATQPQTSQITQTQPQTTPLPADSEARTLRGSIVEAKALDAATRTVTIEVRILNPSGGIITERETFTVNNSTNITRGGASANFGSVVINDVVTAKVLGGVAQSLSLEEKDRRFSATVLEKRTDPILSTQYYSVMDSSGVVHELIVTASTALTRKGMGAVKYSDIRIGDTLDLISEYSTIKEAYAYGSQGYTEGTITEINISQSGAYIILEDSARLSEKYHVIEGAFDAYSLRVNSQVRLRLDSKEIEAVNVLKEADVNYYTGWIDSISARYITLRSSAAAGSATTRVYYDTNVVVTDSTNGAKSTVGSLYQNMKVYIRFTDGVNYNVASITILSK